MTGFSGSTRVKVRFSLNSQNHPSEIARRKRVSHQGHVRNMRQCEHDRAALASRMRKKSFKLRGSNPKEGSSQKLKVHQSTYPPDLSVLLLLSLSLVLWILTLDLRSRILTMEFERWQFDP